MSKLIAFEFPFWGSMNATGYVNPFVLVFGVIFHDLFSGIIERLAK